MGRRRRTPLRSALRPRPGRRLGAGHRQQAETKLGLDLKGGVQLVLQGRPDPAAADDRRRVDGPGDRHHPRGLRPARRLGDRGLARRQRPDPGRHPRRRPASARRPNARPSRRASTSIDWEPNLIGREKRDRRPPGPATRRKGAQRSRQTNGRPPGATSNKPENQQLIFAGAFPTEYAAAKLASEQKPCPDCENCSQPSHLLPVREEGAAQADRRARVHQEDLYIDPERQEATAHAGIVVKVPQGTIVVSEKPTDSQGQVLENAEPGWFALKDNPALSGTEITRPKQETDEFGRSPTSPSASPTAGRKAFQEVTRTIAQRGAARAIGAAPREEAAKRSPATSRWSSTTKSRRGRSSTSPRTRTGSTAAPGAQISGGFNSIAEAQDLASYPPASAPCRSTST